MAVRTRPYHHGGLRDALLRAGEQALGAGRELSLRELAREVGVSHAAPRRHFPDKQALLDALAIHGFERLGAALRGAAASQGSFEERLSALARAYVAFAVDHAALLELMYAGKHRPDAGGLREAAERAFDAPLALIAEGQALGAVRAGDPLRVAEAAWAAIHGLGSLAAGGMLQGGEEAIDATIAVVARGLRP